MVKKSKNPIDSLPQPPWVWGSPKEVFEWWSALPGKSRDKKQTMGSGTISNPHIHFELESKKNLLLPDSDLQRLLVTKLGLEKISEEFDIVLTAEKFLKVLSRAKFKNINEIEIDGKIIYSNPEKWKDVIETLEILLQQGEGWKKSNKINITATNKGPSKCKALVKINRIHRKTEYAIDVHFEGEIKKESFLQFIEYLKRNLEVVEVL
jgi:hypothetical protein